jgi:hypothetical protein
MHVQITVSRKDASNSIKLSPLNNSKGKNAVHSQKVGQFDRVAFKQGAEKLFDQMFSYERSIEESFRYANTLKHGSYEQKLELKAEQRVRQTQKMPNVFVQPTQGKGLFDIVLKDSRQDYGVPTVDDGRRKKKKRKRGHDHDQSKGLSM